MILNWQFLKGSRDRQHTTRLKHLHLFTLQKVANLQATVMLEKNLAGHYLKEQDLI